MKTLFTLLLTIIFFNSFAQAPDWIWSDGMGGNTTDRGRCVYTDPLNGDVVVAGFYESSGISFGSVALTNTLNNFTSDIFIAKYNAAGVVQWAQSFGGTGSESANGVAVDANGNVVVTGFFDSPSLTFGTTTLNSSGGINCFVLKLNSAGNVLWAKQSTGTESEYGTNIAIDNTGDILVGGYFKSSTFSFDAVNASIIGAGTEDIFVAKFDAAGLCQWINVAGGTKLDDLQGITTDNNNNVIISGGFQSAVLNAGSSTLTNFQVNTYDAFVIKYSSTGALSWITGMGGFYSENAMNVTTGLNDNIFITGYFETQSLTVGPSTITNTSTGGFLDVFTACLNPSGIFQWAQSCGGATDDYGSGIATDASGNVFITGYFDSDSLSAGINTLVNAGSFDILLAKYTESGQLIWAKSTGGAGVDRGESISVTNTGQASVTGYFNSNTINFGSNTLNNASDSDVFLAKLDNTAGLNDNPVADWIKICSDNTYGTIHIQSQYRIDKVIIANMMGQITLIADPKTTEYVTPVYNPGTYIVTVISNNVELRKKLIILK